MTAQAKIEFRKLADMRKDPANARTHSPEQKEMIAASIRRFGWTAPMLVDDVVRAGNGRYDAAEIIYAAGEDIYLAPGKERGGKKIPRGTAPIIDCTGWTDEERTAYALADNQLALQADWDRDRLTEALEGLSQQDFPLEIVGFDTAALEALASLDPGAGGGREPGDPTGDSGFSHVDQYGVIVMCKDEAEQESIFTRLRDEGLNVKVVVV